jgi:hypothetical protein
VRRSWVDKPIKELVAAVLDDLGHAYESNRIKGL